MQQPSRLQLVAATSTGALVGGVVVRAADDEEHLLVDAAAIIPMVCMAAVALTALRRRIARSEQRAKADLAVRYRLREEALEKRERQVSSREALLQRREFVNDLRMSSLANRLGQIIDERAQDRIDHEELRNRYEDLAADHDELVRRELQQGAARFTTHATEPTRLRTAAGHDGPRDPRGPSAPVMPLRPREHHEPV